MAAMAPLECQLTAADGIEPNPRHTTIDRLAQESRAARVDVVIGLGGGSVLDAAKAIAMLLRTPGSCFDYEGRNRFSQSAPFIAIPTTCGTGSEVTWVSVVTHAGQRRKLSVKGDAMFPDAALVDADLLQTLPAHLVAYTGLDALTHALEAYTGTHANPTSDALAEKAIAVLLRYLERAVQDIAGDAAARNAVMRASTLAGVAFGNADVAGVHCLSETLGGFYDVPHGLANAMLLVPTLRYHLEAGAVDASLYRLAQALWPEAAWPDPRRAAIHVLDKVEALVAALKLPSFASFGIPETAYPRIAVGAVANGSNGSNPQPMAAADYLTILRRL